MPRCTLECLRSLDVGVVGCGTAGSAAAIFLARGGHRVTVYERVASPTAVGAGITIQPTGLHVLARLGLHAQIVARGARIERLLCENCAGKTIFDLAYATVDPSIFGLGLHRGVLFRALHGAAVAEPRVRLVTGVEIVDLARAETRGRWSWFVDADRERHGPHELVIVADGSRSQLRDDSSTSKRLAAYPWGALWFVAKDPRGADEPMARTLHQRVDKNHTMLGLLPTGRLGDERLLSLFWSIRGDRLPELRARGLEPWKASVRALGADALEPVLDQIDDIDQLIHASYHDVVMHRWHTRNVVYLGDAAHATSPQLGQGCNLALWDAMELADCIAEEPRDLPVALARYSRRRADHLAFYQLATRWLTPFFQGDVGALGSLRDVAMPLAARIPAFRKLMTLSLFGVVDGFVGRTLRLSLPSV